MFQRAQFRRILPIAETFLSLLFGGWGLWIRNSVLSQHFLNSNLWNTTAAFHVWPWPFKFAVVQNMPAFVIGLLVSWPVDAFRPGLPEWVYMLPALLFVPLLWYLIGTWLDHRRSADNSRYPVSRHWILLAVFTAICAAASSIPESIGRPTSAARRARPGWSTVAMAPSSGWRTLRPPCSRRARSKRRFAQAFFGWSRRAPVRNR